MNHIKTMLCGNFIGIDKLEQLKLLQSDPLVNEFSHNYHPSRVKILANHTRRGISEQVIHQAKLR
jgi:hypothetical protein